MISSALSKVLIILCMGQFIQARAMEIYDLQREIYSMNTEEGSRYTWMVNGVHSVPTDLTLLLEMLLVDN